MTTLEERIQLIKKGRAPKNCFYFLSKTETAFKQHFIPFIQIADFNYELYSNFDNGDLTLKTKSGTESKMDMSLEDYITFRDTYFDWCRSEHWWEDND